MIGYYILLVGPVVFVGAITLLDWIGQRQDGRARDRAA
jgi:hypothetical protein